MMSGDQISEILKAFGVPGGLVALFLWLAIKTDIFKREEPQRSDVLDEVKALRAESAEQNREIRRQVATLESQVTDRLARVETTQRAQERRVERLEDRKGG